MLLYTSNQSSIVFDERTPDLDQNILTSFQEHSNSKTRNFSSITEKFTCLGLKELSKLVYQIIETQQSVNLQQILSEIKKIHPQKSFSVNQPRRIYDCLNVMLAMGIIKKIDKTYSIKQNEKNHYNFELKREFDHLSMVKTLIEQNLERRKKLFQQLTKKKFKLDQLVNRNKCIELDQQEQIFKFPFLVLKTQLDEQIQIGYTSQEVLIESQNHIQIQEDLDIIIDLDLAE